MNRSHPFPADQCPARTKGRQALLAVLAAAVGLACAAAPASAGITQTDVGSLWSWGNNGGSNTVTGNISNNFTVNTAANVLIVDLDWRSTNQNSTSTPIYPTVTYNGTALTRAASALGTATTFIDSAIYYLNLPTLGSSNALSVNFGSGINSTSYAINAFSLSGVDTTLAPQSQTGWTSSTVYEGTTNTTESNTLSNITSGSWAVVASNYRNGNANSLTASTTGTSGASSIFVTTGSGGNATNKNQWEVNDSNSTDAGVLLQNITSPTLTVTETATAGPGSHWTQAAAVFAAAPVTYVTTTFVGPNADATNPGSGNWSAGANWNAAGVPAGGLGQTLSFGNDSSHGGFTATNDIPGLFTVNVLNLNNADTAHSDTLAGSGTAALQFNGSSAAINMNGAGNVLLASSLPVNTVPLTVNLTGTGVLTIAGNIAGGGSVTTTGGGSLILSGVMSGNGAMVASGTGTVLMSGSNTFTGGTTIASGTLQIGTNNALPIGSTITLGTATSGGTLDLNGVSQQVNGVAIASGATVASQVITNSAVGTGTLVLNGTGASTLGTITDGGTGKLAALTINAGVVTIRGTTNTFSGGTTLNGGVVYAKTSGSLGTGILTINGGTLNPSQDAYVKQTVVLSNSAEIWNANFTMASDYWNGAWPDGSGDLDTGAGPVTLSKNITVSVTGWSKPQWVNWQWNLASLIVSGVVGDGGNGYGLTLSGGSNLTLNATNTYSGITKIVNGTISFSKVGAFGTGTSDIVLGDTTGTGSAGLIGSNTTAAFTRNITVTGGNTGTASISSWVVTPNYAGTITLGSVVSTVPTAHGLALNAGQWDCLTISGKIQDVAGLTGPGGVVTISQGGNGWIALNGANTFTGGVNLNSGDLELGNLAGLGTGKFTINGGSFNNNTGVAGTLPNNNVQVWNGDFTYDGSSSLNMGTGTVSLGTSAAATRTVWVNGNTLTVGGVISNGTNSTTPTVNLTKANGGTLALTGANTYTGVTTISGGILSTNLLANGGSASGIGASSNAATNLVLNGGTLQYTGAAVSTDRSFTFGNATTASGGGLDASGTGALIITGTITNANTAASTQTLTLSGTSTAANTLNSPIVNGSGSALTAVTKSGVGTWILAGASTYTGATAINAGKLALGNGGSLGASAVTASNTATFGVVQNASSTSNAIGSTLTMNAGSAFTMADGFTSTLNVAGTANLYAGTAGTAPTYTFDIAGTTIALSDQLAIAGAATLTNAGAKVVVNAVGNLSVGNTYTLVTAASGLSVNSLSLASGSSLVAFGNMRYALTLNNTDAATTVTVTSAGAASLYWTGNQGSIWNTPASTPTNWSLDSAGLTDGNTTPNYLTDVYLTALNNNPLTTLGADTTINSLKYTSNAAATTIGAGNTLTINAGITVASGSAAQTINAPVALGLAQTWTNSSSNPLTVSGPISGTVALALNGTGTTVFSGTNTGFTGNLALTNGKLQIAAGSELGGATSIAIGAPGTPATLDYTGTGASTAATPITLAGGATGGGIVQVDTTAANLTLSGAITGSGALTKNGSGTLTLNNLGNSFSGGFTINSGTVLITSGGSGNTALGNGPVVVNSGAILQGLAQDAFGYGEAITIMGGGTVSNINTATRCTLGNIVFNGGGTLTATGSGDGNGAYSLLGGSVSVINPGAATALINAQKIALQANTVTFNVASGTAASQLTISSILSNFGGNNALTKTGAGTMTLTGSNTYTGGTTVQAGELDAASLPKNTALTVTGGKMKLTAATSNNVLQTLSSLTVSTGATVDLTNHDLLIPHALATTTVLNYVSTVTTSSTVAANNGGTAATAIAWVSGSDYIAATGLSTFDGSTLNNNDLVGKYTYAGDANLDGKITADDYLALDLGYMFNLTGWTHGDFAQTGTIGVNDFAIIDNSYLHQNGSVADGEIALHTQWFGAAYTDAFNALNAPAAVPEPASLALLGLGAVALLRRRNRK